MRRLIQGVTACLLVLANLTLTPLAGPENALALDETIATCDWDTFSATLDAVQADGGGTITFDCAGTIVFANELTISTDVTIIGNGAVTFDGNASTQFFTVNETARLALSGLTLQNGDSDTSGGAIDNDGTLTVTASTFSGNSARFGGAISTYTGSTLKITGSTFTDNAADHSGGAILDIESTAKVTDSTFNGNHAVFGGGAISNFADTAAATLEITGSTFTDNTSDLAGGAIENGGTGRISTAVATVVVTASTFTDNTADRSGGAIHNYGGVGVTEVLASDFTGNRSDSSDATGGAISNLAGTIEVAASTFTDNAADHSGGAIYNNDGMVDVSDSDFLGNVAAGGGAIANLAGTLEVAASTFDSNSGPSLGGAILNERGTVEVIASDFTGNRSDPGSGFASSSGGAISNIEGTIEVVASTFTDNYAHDAGGSIASHAGAVTVTASAFTGNVSGAFGGAISSTAGPLDVTASTFRDNGHEGLFYGGAIYNENTGKIRDSTFSGNEAIWGGAILNAVGGAMEVTASTFTGNTATLGAAINNSWIFEISGSTFSGNHARFSGGLMLGSSLGNVVDISGSILADTTLGFNCSGSTIISGGSNLDDDGSCGFGADEEGEVNLADLADNGGPTQTMLPEAPSDALINTADCAHTTEFDQRGAPRPDSGCDIGAVEVGAAVPVQIVAFVSTTPNPLPEGPNAAILAIAYGPDNDNLNYRLDCDGDGAYETSLADHDTDVTGACTFPDNGSFNVGLQVCAGGDPTNCDTASLEEPVTVTNLPPVIAGVVSNGPVDEGSPVTIIVIASDPAGASDPLQYAFDCDNDGNDYETDGTGNQGTCTFSDEGSFTVGVEVSDDDGGRATTTKTVEALNVAPTVDAPSVNPSPTDEGKSVVANATFDDPGALDTHTCTVDYGDGSDPQDGTVDGNTCTGPEHIYLDDDPSGTPSDDYTVTITVTDNDAATGNASAPHTVNNVAPTIDAITTNAPVPQGQPAAITVSASDPGVNDVLNYAFDCDENGSYEAPGAGNQGECMLDPSQASTTINVQVSDDDGGATAGSVVVSQTVTLCASYANGAISGPTASGGCPPNMGTMSLPLAVPTTLCINPHSAGTLRWSPAGSCTPSERVHVVPDSGPLAYCQNIYTRTLRHSFNGQCSANEQAGVIPG